MPIRIEIPGKPALDLEHLVLDYNGTLAGDGRLLLGVREGLERLAPELSLHVVTGDTFGRAAAELAGIPCRLTVLPAGGQAEAKQAYVDNLGSDVTACIGNGRNDALMLDRCALGLAVIQQEGAATVALLAADVVVRDIREALALLIHPRRLTATLRE